MLRYALQVDPRWDAHAAYALDLLLDQVGVVAQRVTEISEADVVYAPESSGSLLEHTVWIRADRIDNWDSATARVGWLQGTPVLYQTLAPEPAHSQNGDLGGDILYSTYALATGSLEQQQGKNKYGVPIGADSFLQKAGLLEFPAVASYSAMLAQSLRQRRSHDFDRIDMWPPGKKCAVVISHDVDQPLSPGNIMRSYYSRYLMRNLTERRWRTAARAFVNWAEIATRDGLGLTPRPERDPNFCFDAWMELEQKLRTKSCFYVAVLSSADRLSSPDDVTYDFRHPSITNTGFR